MGACLFNVALRPWEVMFVPLTIVPLGRIDECEVSPVCARRYSNPQPTGSGAFQNTSTPGPSEQRFL